MKGHSLKNSRKSRIFTSNDQCEYMIGKPLRYKINELFEYRDFPLLYQMGGLNGREVCKFNDLLVHLQAQIYYLDAYLESNWILNNDIILEKWQDIYQSLGRLDIEKKRLDEYVIQIKKYQLHEIQLRKNLMPTRLNTEYYYFFKSCDVKLMRRLIYEKLPILKSQFKLADWRYFDLVTEINDDATDLEEDLDSINGNMILIAYYELGREATIDYFCNFLDYCAGQSSKRLSKTSNKILKNVHIRTIQQITQTKKIIKESQVLKSETESLLYTHIKVMK